MTDDERRAQQIQHEIALLLNKLILASSAQGRQSHGDTPPEDRITDADIDGIERKILDLLTTLSAPPPRSRRR